MKDRYFMLDLCAGLGGASIPMRLRGWRVVTVDNNPQFNTDVVADIRTWSWHGSVPDLLWMSPPCTQFAREFMPWSKTGVVPDMSIFLACLQLVERIKPRYWVIENVKGAIKWFRPYIGMPRYACNPYFLWGYFPDISHVLVSGSKSKLSSRREFERSLIPYKLSFSLAVAIEASMLLPFEEGICL